MMTKADITSIFDGATDIGLFTLGTYPLNGFPVAGVGGGSGGGSGNLLMVKPDDIPDGIMVSSGELVVKVANYNDQGYKSTLNDVIMAMVLQPIVREQIYATEIINEFNERASNNDDKIGGANGISVDDAINAINASMEYKGIKFGNLLAIPQYMQNYTEDVAKFKEVILDIMRLLAQGTGLVSKKVAYPVKLYNATDTVELLFETNGRGNPKVADISPYDVVINPSSYDSTNNAVKYENIDDSNVKTEATAYLNQEGIDAVNAFIQMFHGLVTDSVGATAYGLSRDHINDYAVEVVEDYLNTYDFPTDADTLEDNLTFVEYYNGDTLDVDDIAQKLQAIHDAGYEALQLGAGLATTNVGGVKTERQIYIDVLNASMYAVILRQFAKGYANYIMNNADNKADLTSSTVETNCWDKTFGTYFPEATMQEYANNHDAGEYFEILDTIPILTKSLDSNTICTGLDNNFEAYGTFLNVFSNSTFYTPLVDACDAVLDMLPTGAEYSIYDAGATSAQNYLNDNSNTYPTDGTQPGVDLSPVNWSELTTRFDNILTQIYNAVTLNRSHSGGNSTK